MLDFAVFSALLIALLYFYEQSFFHWQGYHGQKAVSAEDRAALLNTPCENALQQLHRRFYIKGLLQLRHMLFRDSCTIYRKSRIYAILHPNEWKISVCAKNRIQFSLQVPVHSIWIRNALSGCNAELQEVYYQTKEGNGQKWLMLDLEQGYQSQRYGVSVRCRAYIGCSV